MCCVGVMRLAGGCGAHLGLAKGNRGLLDLLGHPFALGLMSKVGKYDSFALGAASPVIWLVISAQAWLVGVEGWKSLVLGIGPIDLSDRKSVV